MIVALVIAGAFLAWKVALHNHRLSFVPREMNVSRILYVSEKSWGIGLPSDNESGVIVYELPTDLASDTLGSLPWQQTPATEESWLIQDTANDVIGSRPQLRNYLNRHGFGVRVDAGIARMVDDALVQPGNYYAFGRGGGVLILIPKAQRIVYAYSG